MNAFDWKMYVRATFYMLVPMGLIELFGVICIHWIFYCLAGLAWGFFYRDFKHKLPL